MAVSHVAFSRRGAKDRSSALAVRSLTLMTDHSAEFIAIAKEAGEIAKRADELDTEPLEALTAAAEDVAQAWSGSNLGYQANVYYEGFEIPPPGATFSREWGFEGIVLGSRGEWRQHRSEDVVAYIEARAGSPDLASVQAVSDNVRPAVESLIQRARSVAAKIAQPHDDYVKENLEELQHVSLPSIEMLARAQMRTPSGRFAVRDMRAFEGGWQPAGHQTVLAKVMHVKSPYAVAQLLASVCERLGRHLEGEGSSAERAVVQLGRKIFIGHGGKSKEHLEVGLWLTDLGLEWEYYDREPTPGLSTKERLLQMLDNAQLALLLLTPEDEDAQGK